MCLFVLIQVRIIIKLQIFYKIFGALINLRFDAVLDALAVVAVNFNAGIGMITANTAVSL